MEKIQILVVEDEYIIANEIKEILVDLGYVVPYIVASGEDALQKTKECKPDLILLDIKLKGEMNGIETASKIHSLYDIPVIYLTAYVDKKTLDRAKITSPYGYLVKPFNDRELHASIEIALYKHRAEKERERLLIEQKRLITELNEALDKVKTLSGFIPICAACKKIRNDKGYWEQVEDYIREHSEAEFTHSMCPECAEKFYPELYKKAK